MSILATVAEPMERLVIDPMALRRFSVAEYHQMIETGILTPDDRVELLDGWIVKKMSQNPPHAGSISRATRFLARVLPDDWSVRIQLPITLRDSEPEPDIVLARGKEGTCDRRHPEPADIGVLMEIGDTSLLADRRQKGAIYAGEKIPVFWLIDANKRTVEVYTKPRGGKYQKMVEYKETLPLVLDGIEVADIAVSDLIAK